MKCGVQIVKYGPYLSRASNPDKLVPSRCRLNRDLVSNPVYRQHVSAVGSSGQRVLYSAGGVPLARALAISLATGALALSPP